MIKILRWFKWKHYSGWLEPIEDGRTKVPFDEIKKKLRPLKEWMEELVDKGNWKIIVATTEYIILQKFIEELPSPEG